MKTIISKRTLNTLDGVLAVWKCGQEIGQCVDNSGHIRARNIVFVEYASVLLCVSVYYILSVRVDALPIS